MTNPTATKPQVCSGVRPAEKKASGSVILIPKSFGVLVPQCLELSKAGTEKLILPLGATMDEQYPDLN